MMEMNSDPNWLKAMAAQEDGCEVGIGIDLRGLSTDQLLGLMDPILADYSNAIDEIRRRLAGIADVVLAYKPPEKAKAAKQREKRRAKRAQKKR